MSATYSTSQMPAPAVDAPRLVYAYDTEAADLSRFADTMAHMRTCSLFTACAAIVIAVQIPASSALAQISKEWSQCVGREGPVADLIIGGCSAVIQAGQDSPARLATAFNNRGVVY